MIRHVSWNIVGHTTDGFDCPCGPAVLEICSECEGEYSARRNCWKCGMMGLIPCPVPDLYDGPFGLIVIHDPRPQ